MGEKIELSARSQELIDYINLFLVRPSLGSDSPVNIATLVYWLNDDIEIPLDTLKSKEEVEFILASLHLELLHDLFSALPGSSFKIEKEQEDTSWSNKMKFLLLTFAGTLVAGCNGFDSITTLLSILALPSVVVLIAGFVFAILSVVVFYAFDLIQVSNNLGIRLRDASKLLDVYLLQLEEIQSIRKKINTYCLSELSSAQLDQLNLTMLMLRKRFAFLIEASKQFDLALSSKKMQAAKFIFSGMAGMLFFGSGFFAGQSVAIFILSLFITAVTPTFLPVIAFSLITGTSAFSLYWYIERVGLRKLISGWFGLDEYKLERLCDSANLLKEEKKLQNLNDKIISSAHLARKIYKIKPDIFEGDHEVDQQKQTDYSNSGHIGKNIYSFYSKNSDDIPNLSTLDESRVYGH